jgi:hypothetical protein
LGNAVKVGLVDVGGFAQAAEAMGVFALRQMAASGAKAQGLAGGGDFKPLGHGFLGFDAFRTSHNSIQKSMHFTHLPVRSK